MPPKPPPGTAAEESAAEELIPLTDLAFNILVSLKDEALHGYALLKVLRARTGRSGLRTGTVYAALARLEESGLVEEAEDAGSETDADDRRRYYRITELGIAAARAEAARLDELLRIARRKDILREAGG